jgi:peptidoglycan hydrolase CwlO-like protein
MRKIIQAIAISGAFLALGFSMPSCPGQQALQQQMDILQAKASEAGKELQVLVTKLDQANSEISKTNAVMAQMNTVITEQKLQIEQLEASMKILSDKITAPKAPPKNIKTHTKKRGN